MEAYKDNTGREIKIGDVLIYDEGKDYGRSIEEVVEHEGELASIMRVGNPPWSIIDKAKPMPLRFYKLWPEHGDNITFAARVIDIPHSIAFTPEYAASVFDT